MKGQIRIQNYCFNEAFQVYQKNDFAEAFFKDPMVASTLEGYCSSWSPVGVVADKVEVELIPSSATSMSLFDRLGELSNNIVRNNDSLVQCLYEEMDGFVVADELRRVLLDPESEAYSLFPEDERNQFLFRLFRLLCLGGQWCQYEDSLQPYLDTTRLLYKQLLRVQKDAETKQTSVVSVVLSVAASKNGDLYYPRDTHNIQNCAYLIIDPCSRQLTTLIHQFGGSFQE